MLCFVVSKKQYEDIIAVDCAKPEFFFESLVCIGSVNDLQEAQSIANMLPCLTEVVLLGNINQCVYIVCNY